MIALALAAALLNPAVTPATQAQTICRPGWAQSVRPSTSYIRLWKRLNVPVGADPKAYTVDHWIALEMGGNPLAPNLRLQLKAEARRKDREENALHRKICNGSISLRQAQERIVGDWPR